MPVPDVYCMSVFQQYVISAEFELKDQHTAQGEEGRNPGLILTPMSSVVHPALSSIPLYRVFE